MILRHFPFVSELIGAIEDRDCPDAYFREFESRVDQNPDMARVWREREREFACLERKAWEQLKAEAIPYLTRRDPRGRGWAQLISILNQARAHNYMAGLGCVNIEFIPRSKRNGIETPDLVGMLNETQVLCEVKTIGISDLEVSTRRDITSRTTQDHLPPELLSKLDSTLEKAGSQLRAYKTADSRCLAFVVVNFDEWPGEYKAEYYRQIDAHLDESPDREFRIVFYNERSVFHQSISMRNADVVNEEG